MTARGWQRASRRRKEAPSEPRSIFCRAILASAPQHRWHLRLGVGGPQIERAQGGKGLAALKRNLGERRGARLKLGELGFGVMAAGLGRLGGEGGGAAGGRKKR